MLVQHFFFVERGQIGTPERGAGKSQSGGASPGKGPGEGKEDQRGNEASLCFNFKASDSDFSSPQTT